MKGHISAYLLTLFYTLGLFANSVSAIDHLPVAQYRKQFEKSLFRTSRNRCHLSPVRMMPLGDSITHGSAIAGGYRIALWQRLNENNYGVDFVGSEKNGPPTLDPDHEGHPGKAISFIQQEIAGWLETHNPQVILLMIGTNDILRPDVHDFPSAAERLSALIDSITQLSPATDVFVASVTPLNDPDANRRAVAFNTEIPPMVESYSQQGKQVYFVDMYRVISLADLADGIHPNEAGYRKMSEVWYNAVTPILEERCTNHGENILE